MRAEDSARMARRAAKVTDDQLRAVDWDALPRFMTIDDVKAAVKGETPNAALATIPERATTPAPAQRQAMSPELHNETMRNINDALDSTIDAAVDNANVYDLDNLENRLRQLGLASLESLGEPGQFVQDPLGRMNRMIEYVENASLRERSRGTQLGDAVADGLDDFLVDLRGIQHHVERQMRTANEVIDEEPRNAKIGRAHV